jgi:hypothetical protein
VYKCKGGGSTGALIEGGGRWCCGDNIVKKIKAHGVRSTCRSNIECEIGTFNAPYMVARRYRIDLLMHNA